MTRYTGAYSLNVLEATGREYQKAHATRQAAMAALETQVREAAAAGVPKEQIARTAGISKPTVYRILRGS